MRQTSGTRKSPGEKIVKDIKRATRRQYSSEEKIRGGPAGCAQMEEAAAVSFFRGTFQMTKARRLAVLLAFTAVRAAFPMEPLHGCCL